MCLAKDYIGKIDKLFTEIQAEKDLLSKKLSQVDKELTDIYHFVEFDNFNASQGYKYAKRIQELRRIRREIKDEFSPICDLSNSLSQKVQSTSKKLLENIERNENKKRTYTPRVVKNI